MPLLRQKYQPYFPDPDAPAHEDCEGTYCHPIQIGDMIKSQFSQTPCGANAVEDPNFEDITLGAEVTDNGTFTGGAAEWETGVVPTPLPSGGWTYDSNNIEHTSGTNECVYQTALAVPLVAGFYQITIDITRVAGSVYVQLGDGGSSVRTSSFDTTDTHTEIVYLSTGLNQLVSICPNTADDFTGWVNSVSVKLVTFNAWDPNASWTLGDDTACHIEGSTGILTETVADYMLIGEYWEVEITASGVVAGTVDVYISDILAGTISTSGTFRYYGTPTVDGVLSFDPSADFVGCLSAPDARELKNNHLAYWVDPDGTEYQIGQHFDYFERWVTLLFDPSQNEEEIPYGCSYIKVIDACVVTGDNLVINGGFADNGADWNAPDQQRNYATPSGEAQLSFSPISGTDYISNGDFSVGFTDWTAGAGWSISGGGALHTAGSTATLVQSVNVPAVPPAPTQSWYYLQFTISGRTAGSVSVSLENITRTGFSANDTMVTYFQIATGGVVDFTITPTTDFDGTIDDVQITFSLYGYNSFVSITNTVNTNILAGNYELSFDITAQDDPLMAVGARIIGQAGGATYFSGVGTHTLSIPNYVPGAQQVQLIGRFETANYGISGTINIDNVSLVAVEPFEATYTTECLNYQEEFTDTKMVVAYCDQESFGFEFTNTGFTFQQRMECRTLNSNYPQELQIQKTGLGNARITYASLEKYWIFATGFMSETAHDTLAVMRLCDHFLIGPAEDNGTEYITGIDEYAPEWRGEGDYNLATAAFQIRIKEGGMKFNRHL